MAKSRTFKFWVKGNRFDTEIEMTTSDPVLKKADLLHTYANGRSLKTFECDGIIVRNKDRA